MRTKITLACTECKQRNYDSYKNKKTGRFVLPFVFGERVPTLIEKYILFLMACIYYIWSE